MSNVKLPEKKKKKNGIEKVFRVKVGEGGGLPLENDGDTRRSAQG